MAEEAQVAGARDCRSHGIHQQEVAGHMAPQTRSGWSHGIHRQEVTGHMHPQTGSRGERWCSAHLSPFNSVQDLAHGVVAPTFRVCVPVSLRSLLPSAKMCRELPVRAALCICQAQPELAARPDLFAWDLPLVPKLSPQSSHPGS